MSTVFFTFREEKLQQYTNGGSKKSWGMNINEDFFMSYLFYTSIKVKHAYYAY